MAVRRAVASILALGCGAAAREAAPNTELVVAHYNEDMTWAEEWNNGGVHLRVYTKGKVPTGFKAEELPNVGRESHTYLTHIVKNYDALANWTVFTQGAAPRWGYRHGDSGSGHLTDEIDFKDYMEPFHGGKDSFFALSTVAHLPSGIQSTRLGMLTDSLRTVSNAECPAGGSDGWSAWWVDEGHPHRKAGQKMLAFYNRYVLQNEATAEAALAPVTLAFVQGARFAVSRERILKRPRAYYEALLERVSHSRNPLEGFFLEAMWHDVFHPERVQAAAPLCEYLPLPTNLAAMSYGEMFEDTARRITANDMIKGFFDSRQLSDAYNPTTESITGTTEEVSMTTEEVLTTHEEEDSEEVSTSEEEEEVSGESTTDESTTGASEVGESVTTVSAGPPVQVTQTVVATGSFGLTVATQADYDLVVSPAGLLGAAEALAAQGGFDASAVVVTVANDTSRRLSNSSNFTVNFEYTITLTGGAGDTLPTAAEMQTTLGSDTFAAQFTTSLNSALATRLGDSFGGVTGVTSFTVAAVTVTNTASTTEEASGGGGGGNVDNFAGERRAMSSVVGLLAAALAIFA